ncbi:MAG: hypothetical protein KC609_15945, partial [Myxococcales bacterium]|nr:hypothetical protein [Myxococcales bacterium]
MFTTPRAVFFPPISNGEGRPMSAERQSRQATVTLEDLVMFINACFACSGQREFYSDQAGQAVSIDFLHQYIAGNYRRLYARTLAAGINHFNQTQIIVNLLASGRDVPDVDRREEGELIRYALRSLPPQRALRALDALRQRRVNNRRTRAVIRDYLESRRDPTFDAVKYRNRIRGLAAHAHLGFADERGAFLFRGWRERRFETELFETFRAAHYSQSAVYQLPYTVAAGLAAKHEIPEETFLEGIEGKMTELERLRVQGRAARAEISIDVELTRMPLTRLCSYLVSRPLEQREAERERFGSAMQHVAKRFVRLSRRKLGRV